MGYLRYLQKSHENLKKMLDFSIVFCENCISHYYDGIKRKFVQKSFENSAILWYLYPNQSNPNDMKLSNKCNHKMTRVQIEKKKTYPLSKTVLDHTRCCNTISSFCGAAVLPTFFCCYFDRHHSGSMPRSQKGFVVNICYNFLFFECIVQEKTILMNVR